MRMKIPFRTTVLTTLCAAIFATPVLADWGEVWKDVEKIGKKIAKLGKIVWDEAKEEWEKLDLNYNLLQAFGDDIDEESAFVGRFYDLKHPIDGKAKPLARNELCRIFNKFNEEEWDQEIFNAYYSPKVRLYAPYFYLPRCKAAYGPEAFQCNENLKKGEPKVEPSAWVVVYRAMVEAPESGTFRFVGMGDDIIMVRFNRKLVLQSGWAIATRGDMDAGTRRQYQMDITKKKKGHAIYQYENTPHWNERLGGIPSGKPFEVEKGKKYPMEILVSEIPGCEFGFCLLLEKLENPKKIPYGIFPQDKSPILHLFRTCDKLPDPKMIKRALTTGGKDYSVNDCKEGPPFLEDSLIWKADFDAADKIGLFDRIFGRLLEDEDETAMGTARSEGEEAPEGDKEDDPELFDREQGGNILEKWRLW